MVPVMSATPNYNADVTEQGEYILAEAILAFLQNKELCKRYVEQGAERVKAFSTQKYVNAFIDLAEEK